MSLAFLYSTIVHLHTLIPKEGGVVNEKNAIPEMVRYGLMEVDMFALETDQNSLCSVSDSRHFA